MKKLWPMEDNCTKLKDNFASCEITNSTCENQSSTCKMDNFNLRNFRKVGIVLEHHGPPEDQHSHHGHQDNPNAFRSMRDRMHPPRMNAPSCIVPPIEQLVIRPHIVPFLPTFHGMESENPYAHIKEFQDVCNTFQEGGASIDLMRLKLFPFTLKDKAKIWLNSLRPRSIRTWTDLQAAFLKKFFLTHRTNGLKRGWDEPNKEEVGKTKSQPNALNAKAGMYTLNEDNNMKAKVAAMTRRLEELELKKIREVQAVSETLVQVMPCSICQSYEHLVEECPTIPAVREMFEDQGNPRALQYTQPGQASQQASNLEQAIVNLSKVVGDFVGDQKSINAQLSQRIVSVENTLNKMMDGMQNDLSQKIDNLLYSISRLTNLNTVQEKGRFPSQPHQNPKSIHEVEAHKGESSQVRDVKALITLRSGTEVELPTPKPHVEKEEEEKETEKREEIKGKKKVMIGGTVVEKALLDLGASVNLLPYSVYKQLGLSELKPTSITLSLADRSVKIPRGIIEDVLVQVDNFYYPVDFVVLDTDPIVKETNYVPIILGRPFLATSKAIITCRNGLMQLTFGNMTLELNIFYMSKKPINPEEDEDPEEESPKLNLKPLPTELKYTYLEENKKCPIVISSSLTTPHEVCLLEVLKRCKKAIGWKISDLKGISPLVYTHHIYMDEEAKSIRQPQRRLNPHMQEVVRAE
uniref:Retrotransposon gag domain-containing protein n=1 Tax=Vitis vinifera TaxID=29760 RepID=A5AZT3_VITVI|nr:hypothetical protein VITISV_024057 [Vitis vinifera]